jgi:CheY-like chemotaxis protein
MREGAPILVVEDDEDMRALITRTLGAAGFPFIEVSDGRAALHAVLDGPVPRLILLDLHLPRMSGRELVDVLRSYARFARIPVVVITAERERDCTVPVAAWIKKPVRPEDVIEAVRRHATGTWPPPGDG